MGVLTKNARILKEAGVTVMVAGHCDERGTIEYNLALGEKRAKAARDYLVSLGVPAGNLRVTSYGESRPFSNGHGERRLGPEPPGPLRAPVTGKATRDAQARANCCLVILAGLILVSGCAPQLNRIETAVQDNRDQIARMQAENKRLVQEMQALNQLMRMDKDAGDETSAMRLTKLSQVSARLDQLMQKLDDNAQYMRELSARVDLLATPAGHSDPGRVQAAPVGARRRDDARRGALDLRRGRTGPHAREQRPGPAGLRGIPAAIRQVASRPTTRCTGWAIWPTGTVTMPGRSSASRT